MWSILKLEVDETQKEFVATNTESIVEAYTTIVAGGIALPFGIYEDSTPIGFLMIGYGEIPEENNPAIARDNYILNIVFSHLHFAVSAVIIIRQFPDGK